jgi:hypothetical protein
MDSVQALREALISEGYSEEGADRHIDALVAHACVCRTRADNPAPSAFREFVNYACGMTRNDRCVDNLEAEMSMGTGVGKAVPAVLFDLIMEGV